MKICYVGQFNEFSVGEPEIAYSLEKLGHKVIKIEEGSLLKSIKEIIGNIDILIIGKFRMNCASLEKENFLKELKIPVITWIFDMYFGI